MFGVVLAGLMLVLAELADRLFERQRNFRRRISPSNLFHFIRVGNLATIGAASRRSAGWLRNGNGYALTT